MNNLRHACVNVQGRIASGQDVFGPLLEKYLLNNKHRVIVELLPDWDLAAKEEAQEKAKLASFKRKLVGWELQDIIKSTQELQEHQVCSLTTCHAQTLLLPHLTSITTS